MFHFLRHSPELFDMKDNWFPALSPPECVPDGCVPMHAAAYEFRMMMDCGVKSKEHEPVYTRTLYISIHLLLMQQPQHWGPGTLCWRPNESWVICHVQSQSSGPACVPFLIFFVYTLHLLFFYFHLLSLHLWFLSSTLFVSLSFFLIFSPSYLFPFAFLDNITPLLRLFRLFSSLLLWHVSQVLFWFEI